MSDPRPITLYIDADACPVKDEAYRVAARYGLKTFVVANAFLQVPKDPLIERVLVPAGPDVADHWIAERASPGAIIITQDIPLASRGVKAGAEVISPKGKLWDANSIGMALATRNLMEDLRSAGETTRGPAPFSPRDRSAFLSSLDMTVNRLKRAGFSA